ncbi:GNAT family N-acetyltransferase [Plantactinospora sp. B5E13]|uniref:GNAT family N-acetyltransferase n=1 Tax=Plantactinospora sp. B5E13 TaxID=3153758 RepID=UPI00325EBC0A
MVEINTARLVLRNWRDADLAPWAAMNADPEVREHLGPLLSPEQAAASMRRFQADLDRDSFGFWALEVRETAEFVGFAGLDVVDEGMPFTGVEAGWRLARSAWGHGYATEAALAVLRYGFDKVGLTEILAVTTRTNLRSQAVMRRIGMTTDPADDFDDPGAADGPLRRCVLYRTRSEPGGQG